MTRDELAAAIETGKEALVFEQGVSIPLPWRFTKDRARGLAIAEALRLVLPTQTQVASATYVGPGALLVVLSYGLVMVEVLKVAGEGTQLKASLSDFRGTAPLVASMDGSYTSNGRGEATSFAVQKLRLAGLPVSAELASDVDVSVESLAYVCRALLSGWERSA